LKPLEVNSNCPAAVSEDLRRSALSASARFRRGLSPYFERGRHTAVLAGMVVVMRPLS
jgi:hypothetical protein